VVLLLSISVRTRRIAVGAAALLLAATLLCRPSTPPPDETEALIEQLRSHDSATRELAIATIKQQHHVPPSLIEPLKLALHDDDPQVRLSAAQALGHLGASGREHLNSLAEICLAEKDPRVQATLRRSMEQVAKAKR
jgi:HEAT repeat protein